MKDSIRFLVLWVGTKCTLKCENCCNLIPHAEQVSYDFIFGSGLWFDSGKIDQPFNNNYLEVEQIYKECTTKECWVLANNYMAQCGKIINLLEIKGGELSENNVIDVTNSRIREIDFRIVLDKFDHNYKTCIPSLCGYCKKREGYIEPAIQIRD